MDDVLERRAFGLELRADGRVLAGLAVPWGRTETCGTDRCVRGGRERFEPGSLLLAPAGASLNLDHDSAKVLADGDGLAFEDRADGLHIRAELPAGALQDEALASVADRSRLGLSIEFRALVEDEDADVRVLRLARLDAVALVKDPAYRQAAVETRCGCDECAGSKPRRRVWL